MCTLNNSKDEHIYCAAYAQAGCVTQFSNISRFSFNCQAFIAIIRFSQKNAIVTICSSLSMQQQSVGKQQRQRQKDIKHTVSFDCVCVGAIQFDFYTLLFCFVAFYQISSGFFLLSMRVSLYDAHKSLQRKKCHMLWYIHTHTQLFLQKLKHALKHTSPNIYSTTLSNALLQWTFFCRFATKKKTQSTD